MRCEAVGLVSLLLLLLAWRIVRSDRLDCRLLGRDVGLARASMLQKERFELLAVPSPRICVIPTAFPNAVSATLIHSSLAVVQTQRDRVACLFCCSCGGIQPPTLLKLACGGEHRRPLCLASRLPHRLYLDEGRGRTQTPSKSEMRVWETVSKGIIVCCLISAGGNGGAHARHNVPVRGTTHQRRSPETAHRLPFGSEIASGTSVMFDICNFLLCAGC